jgi:GntR family transcriptional regulator, N-acetylglucosamine utilization regulator
VKDRALVSLPRALDRDLPIPLYHQLKSQLLKRIETGELSPHARLETEDQLAAAYRVSKATVRQALGELVHAGYLRREQGRGTFVADPRVDQGPTELTSFTDDMQRRGLVAASQVLGRAVVPADAAMAAKLRIAPGARVFRLERLRTGDGEPLAIQTAHIPLDMAPELARERFESGSLYETLERHGLVPVSAHERHWAALIERPQARLLKVKAAAAGLCAERVAFLRDGRPLEYTCSVMRADRYQITLDLVRGEGVLRPVRNVVELDGGESGARSAASQGQNRRRIG